MAVLQPVCYNNTLVASATSYAYSIGVNHGTSNLGRVGDFTANVLYANTCYGMIPGMNSYYNCLPTQDYMKGNNPAGVRRIASNVVFLNGHGDSQNMFFNHNNSGGSYDTGVYYGSDTTKSVGISSTIMSGVDLISFVGCNTASGNDNLTSRAYDRGANTAVGFTDLMHSRTSDGQGWCRAYNDALTNGYTISGAISYATDCYPNSDLGTCAKLYGSSTNTITSGGSAKAQEKIIPLYINDVNIPLENVCSQNVTYSESLGENYSPLIKSITDIDPSFNPEDYSVYVNMFTGDETEGIIVFTYQIGGLIDTNYAFVANVSDGTVKSITSKFDGKPVVNEDELLEKAQNYSFTESRAASQASTLRAEKDVVSEKDSYKYDYETGKLTYQKTVDYIEHDAEDVIIANAFVTELQ